MPRRNTTIRQLVFRKRSIGKITSGARKNGRFRIFETEGLSERTMSSPTLGLGGSGNFARPSPSRPYDHHHDHGPEVCHPTPRPTKIWHHFIYTTFSKHTVSMVSIVSTGLHWKHLPCRPCTACMHWCTGDLLHATGPGCVRLGLTPPGPDRNFRRSEIWQFSQSQSKTALNKIEELEKVTIYLSEETAHYAMHWFRKLRNK
jgi:hypothetical protein